MQLGIIKGLLVLTGLITLTEMVTPSHAILEVDITQGQIKPTPIAVTKFTGSDPYATEIADIISKDLESSGLFILVNPRGFNQSSESILSEGPRFADWQMLSAQCLLTGSVDVSGGTVRVQFRLFDVIRGTQLHALELSIPEDKWRRVAHMVADEVYKRVTGEKGYFNTRIAFIEEHGPRGKGRVFRLGMMDRDGYPKSIKYLTDGKSRVFSPRFSPDNKHITYSLGHGDNDVQVYLHNLETNDKKLLSKVAMSSAPRFSPDGKEMLLTLEKRGTAGIYLRDVASGQMTLLTQHDCIDTSPCFCPEQKRIVFTSDRGGRSQIYVMDRNGGNVNRISFGGGSYSAPVWSPRGDLIAFIKQSQGQYFIGVMRPDGTDERLITSGYLVDTPAWSPNGRVILFSKENKMGRKTLISKLYSVDLTGRGLNEIKTPREATDGNWSHLLDEVNEN